MSGWIAFHRSEEAEALQERHPAAFLLLCQIARRARWRTEPCPVTGLSFGQAMVGDWKKAGLQSEKSYRHALGVLRGAGIVATQGANRGTVATLINQRIFSVEPEETGEHRGEQAGGAKGSRGANTGATNEQRKQRNTGTRKQLSVEIPPELVCERFDEAWLKWIAHRSEIRKPLKNTSAEQQLKKLVEMGQARAIEAILYSIEKGWTGIFEPSNPAGQNGGKPKGENGDLFLGKRARHNNSYNEDIDLP